MKLKFTINEPGQFFHFLDSISLWNIHVRKTVRKYYEKKYALSEKDGELLKKYIKIRRKYSWQLLDSDFYPSKTFKEVKLRIKKRLNKKEFNDLNKIIDHFYPNIHNIFLIWKKNLEGRKKALELETKKHKLKDLFLEIANFYESRNYTKEIYVHLVINPVEHSSGGGANILPMKHITIEPLNLKEKNETNLLRDLSVMAHETLHLVEYGANKIKWKKFKNLVNKHKLNFEVLRESIADTLVPEGYLALKYELVKGVKILKFNKLKAISKYRKSEPGKYYGLSRQKLSAMLYSLTKNQMNKGLSVFEGDYIKKCIEKYVKLLA